MAFKILRKNCCGLDVHKTWIFACIGITDSNGRTEYKQARFSSFPKGLQDLADWLAKYSCSDVCSWTMCFLTCLGNPRVPSSNTFWTILDSSLMRLRLLTGAVSTLLKKFKLPWMGPRLVSRPPNSRNVCCTSASSMNTGSISKPKSFGLPNLTRTNWN